MWQVVKLLPILLEITNKFYVVSSQDFNPQQNKKNVDQSDSLVTVIRDNSPVEISKLS